MHSTSRVYSVALRSQTRVRRNRGSRVGSSQRKGLHVTSSNAFFKAVGIAQRAFHATPLAADQITVTMPALSPTMTEGNLSEWKKKEGDKISPGDVLAEVETDKATVAFEATEPGFLAKILIPNGTSKIQVGTPIAVIVDTAAEIATASAPSSPAFPKSQPTTPTTSTATTQSVQRAGAAPSVPHAVLAMPALSPTMSEGTIVSWKKSVGDKIKAGDALAEIETDKATVTFEATDDGFLAKILVPAGTGKIEVNTPVAIVVDAIDHIPAVSGYDPRTSVAVSPAQTTSEHASVPNPTPRTASAVSQDNTGRLFASPLARRLAQEANIELTSVQGTGPHNRIIAADVRQQASRVSQAPAPKIATPASIPTPAPSSTSFTDIPVTNIRRVIAQRLLHSKQTIPHYYLTMDCQVDKLLQIREQLNAGSDGSFKLSVNDFIIKAAAQALKKVPEVNSEWRGDVVRRYNNVDINVAVSAPQGLFTPLVRDADRKGLASIASEVKEMADKAKAGKLSPDDLTTGTFTISNLGMFGVSNFSAVINPPQACILAVGATEKRVVPNPAYKQSDPESKTSPYLTVQVMSVTLSCDHRVVDGAVGAQWLQAFKSCLENPLKLML